MSRKANPATIGAFVIAALALLVAGLLLFASGSLFSDSSRHAVFFEGSVRGLTVGSPVLFKGVRVGQVTEITLEVNGTSLDIDAPAIIEIEDDQFKTVGEIDDRWERGGEEAVINALIERGLRAQLQTQSFVTGQLAVQLDFLSDPSSKPVYRMPEDSSYASMHEIPAVASDMEEVARRAQQFILELQNVPVGEIAKQVQDTLASIEGLADSAELTGAIAAARSLMESPAIPAAFANVSRAADQADSAMQALSELAGRTDASLPPVLEEANAALAGLRQVLLEAEGTLSAARATLARDSDVRVRVNLLMDELTRTSRSLRALTEMIQRQPESLLRGRREEP